MTWPTRSSRAAAQKERACGPPRLRSRSALWLLIVPIAVLIYGVMVARSFGPSGVPSSDPGYYFLMNALDLAAGRPIVHIDQPGTPLQVIGAAVIDAVHFVGGSGSLVADVIARPGAFIAPYFLVLVVLYALSLLALGFSALGSLEAISAAITVQALPIVFGNYSRVVPITTEGLLLSVVALLCILLLRDLRNEQPRRRWRVPLYGIVIGFGIAVKLTFAPLVLIPLCMLKRVHEVIVYGAAIVAAFVISTAAIWPSYPRLAEWVLNLAAHQGAYGHGPGGVAALSTWIGNLLQLAEQEIVLALAVVAAMVMAARKLLARDARRPWSARERLLMGLSLSAVAQFLVTAKQPDTRYLIPSVASLGLFLWPLAERSPTLRRRMPNELFPVLALVAASILIGSALGLPASDGPAIQAELERHYSGWTEVVYAGSSLPVYALADGNRMAGASFTPELAARYPATYFYDIWSGDIVDWEGHLVRLADIKGARPGIVFEGAPTTDAGGISFAGQNSNGPRPPLPAGLRETFHHGDEAIAEVIDDQAPLAPATQ